MFVSLGKPYNRREGFIAIKSWDFLAHRKQTSQCSQLHCMAHMHLGSAWHLGRTSQGIRKTWVILRHQEALAKDWTRVGSQQNGLQT